MIAITIFLLLGFIYTLIKLMVIWIDLDEVLAELAETVLKENNYTIWWKKIKFEDITDYYIYNIDGIDVNVSEAMELFRKTLANDIERLNIKPIKWVYDKLLEWKNKWYKLKVITARPKELFEKYTLDWLEKHYPWIFDEIYFANNDPKIIADNWQDQTRKWIMCKNLWVDIMIEDNPNYAYDVASCGIKTFLLEKPWNKNSQNQYRLFWGRYQDSVPWSCPYRLCWPEAQI